jgi:hypothetical protein
LMINNQLAFNFSLYFQKSQFQFGSILDRTKSQFQV